MAKDGREHYASVTCRCGHWFEVSRIMLMKRNNTVKAKCPHCNTSATVVLNKQRDVK